MPQWLRQIPPHLWILLVAGLFSVIGQLIKKTKAAKAARERQERLRQAELDLLRTGGRSAIQERPVQTSRMPATEHHAPMMPSTQETGQRQPSRQPSLEEIAEARRRRIEELRRGQKSGETSVRATAPTTPMSSGPTSSVRLPNGIVVNVPAGAQAPRTKPVAPRPQQRAAASTPRPASQRPTPQRTATPPPTPSPRHDFPVTAPQGGIEPMHKLAPDAAATDATKAKSLSGVRAAPAKREHGLVGILGGRDRNSIRRAIIIGEVFGQPKSLRESI